MPHAALLPWILAPLLVLTAAPASAQRASSPPEEGHVLRIAEAARLRQTPWSWELVESAPSPRGLSFSGAQLAGLEGAATTAVLVDVAGQTPAPPRPRARPEAGTIFATLSDNRLPTDEVRDDREARFSPPRGRGLDWSGYEARDRRADDSLSESIQALEWPDLEGGSEPLVPAATRSPDGKRSGVGLGWRF